MAGRETAVFYTRSRESSDSSGMAPPPGDADKVGKLFLLNVFLQNGRNLPVKDASGSSDPYVKFIYKNKMIYQSHTIAKNVNPNWDEKFSYVIDDITAPLRVEVWDYDRRNNDDFMGYAMIDLVQLDSNPVEAKVELAAKQTKIVKDKTKVDTDQGTVTTETTDVTTEQKRDLGYLTLSMQILPAADTEAEEAMLKRHLLQEDETVTTKDSKWKKKRVVKQETKVWTDLVRIVLIEAKNLVEPASPVKSEYPPDTCVKFQLGWEKCKSKVVYNSWSPQWLEQFNMYVRSDESSVLEVALIDVKKEALIGRCEIDLRELPNRKLEKHWYRLNNGITEVLLSLSYSGVLATRTISACDTEDGLVHRFEETATPEVLKSYDLKGTLKNLWDVGYLMVKVHKARGLKGADLRISSDPYCVVALGNAQLETHTEHRTKNPEWYTMFTFFVTDIHAILEVTVFDEDRLKKNEFLGKVSIPLLNIINDEPIWYQLKNQHLTHRVKGEILLEMNIVWNPVRAGLATFLPPEKKYGVKEDPFRPRICIRNLERLNRFIVMGYDLYKYGQYCLSWESPQTTIFAFVMCLIIANVTRPWMIPLGPLLLFAMVFFRKQETGDVNGTDLVNGNGNGNETNLGVGIANDADNVTLYSAEEEEMMAEDDEVNDDRNWKLIRSYVRYKEVSLFYIQNLLDMAATFMEKTKNILEFKQPFVSWLAILCLAIGVVVMYFVPLRFLATAWVIKKFTRKLRRPYSEPSNEVLDFIARAPSDIDLKSYYGYKQDSIADEYINTKLHEYAATRKRGKSLLERLGLKKRKSRED